MGSKGDKPCPLPNKWRWEVVRLHIYVITLMEFSDNISWLSATAKELF